MPSRVHSSGGKSNTPINSTLVARQQTAQPVNAFKSELSNPKFNFHLSNISISSPDRPSQPPPKINQKQQSSDSSRKLKPTTSDSSIYLNKMLIAAPPRWLKTPPMQPKLKVSVAPRNRLQQLTNEKREEQPPEELKTSAIASSSTPPDADDGDNPELVTNRTSELGNSLANIAISTGGTYCNTPPSPLIQPKLNISNSGNKYQQEAHTVATQVVKQINTPNFPPQTTRKLRSLQRDSRQSILKISPLKPKIVNPNPTTTVFTKLVASPEKSSEKTQEPNQQHSAKQEENQPQSPATPESNKEQALKASKTPSAKTQTKEPDSAKKEGKQKSLSAGAKDATGRQKQQPIVRKWLLVELKHLPPQKQIPLSKQLSEKLNKLPNKKNGMNQQKPKPIKLRLLL